MGVDAAPRFIDAARRETAEAGVANARFLVADVQACELDGGFDYVFSRFGTMFFANPVVALRNVRQALVPGGRLCMVVWRRKLDNDWLHRAERVAMRFLTRPEATDQPTCGPGPFSMADADTTTDVLVHAGFEDISLHRCDIEIAIGADLEQAVQFVMAIGPAGELIRLAGSEAERRHSSIVAALDAALAELQEPDGTVRAPASTWIIGACSPGTPDRPTPPDRPPAARRGPPAGSRSRPGRSAGRVRAPARARSLRPRDAPPQAFDQRDDCCEPR